MYGPTNRKPHPGHLLSLIAPLVLFSCPASVLSQVLVRAHKYDGSVQSLAFSPSGSGYAISVAGEEFTDLFETKSGKTLRRLSRGQGDTYALSYSPDERLF